MASIDSIFKKEIKKAEPRQKRVIKWIHYTKLIDNEDQYCNEQNEEEIEALADLIEADQEVLQDLLVKKVGTDEYKIIGGHKRRRACKLLVEKRGKEQFAFLPCYVMDISDIQAEFRLYSSNGHHEKTDYERMRELERMKYLVENYPQEFPQVQGGRMVERLAKLTNMKKTTVGEFLTISRNLSEKGMEKFAAGELKKSAAVELSSMTEKEQDELIDKGITKLKDIREQRKPVREWDHVQEEKNTAEPEEKDNTEQEVEVGTDYHTLDGKSPIIHMSPENLRTICNVLYDYARIVAEMAENSTGDVQMSYADCAERYKKIRCKIESAIGYSTEMAIEKCQYKKKGTQDKKGK